MVYGVNSKVFYNENLFRYPQRMRELRERGYVFASRKDPIGDAAFYRFWILEDPYTKEANTYVPANAKRWGAIGNKNKTASKPKWRYEFDKEKNVFNAYRIVDTVQMAL